jgi:hypothetical protein
VSSLERLAPSLPALELPPSSLRGKRYGEDRLYLLVRDPRTVLAVWELTPALHARAQASARDRGAPPRYRIVIERRQDERAPVLVLATVELPDALQGDRWYVKLPQSGGECRALLGISIAGALDPVLSSSWVPVPPDHPCAEDGAWDLTEEAKAWLLERARAARAAAQAAGSASRYFGPAPSETPR